MKIESLSGYTKKGLSDDLAKWFVDAERCEVAEGGIRSLAGFLKHLDESHHASMTAFDALVRGGKWPSVSGLDIMDDWTYGFDFAKNDVNVLDEDGEEVDRESVYSLGCDGGGNHYVVLKDGRVVVWNHEEDSIEGHTQFANLDVFLWVLLRVAAVDDGKLDKAAIEKDIRALKQGGADFMLDHS